MKLLKKNLFFKSILVILLVVLNLEILCHCNSNNQYEIDKANYMRRKELAHTIAECARELGYDEDSYMIYQARLEWEKADSALCILEAEHNQPIEEVEEDLSAMTSKFDEYPIGAEIWYYFIDKGYSPYVVAGIMGNIMTEAGGQTLNINPTIYGGDYYGICQWSLYYNPQIKGADLEEQLMFLATSMPSEFNNFGSKYKMGFKYDDFLRMTNVKDAAEAFAKCYERCASSSYNIRKQNAEKAYEYFMK